MRATLRVGEPVDLDIGPVAHGGSCVARHEGQVVFVRGTLPGERVEAVITDAPGHGRFLRADTTRVVVASPHRVTPPCAYAARCGGCDWQHVALPEQRQIKAQVIREQLTRLGGEAQGAWDQLVVEPVPGDDDGLRWRTRMRFAVDAAGRVGLHPWHSHDILEIDDCLIAGPAVAELAVTRRPWPGAESVDVVAPAVGPAVALPDAQAGEARVTEKAVGRTWTFDATAFWQVHPGAADTLADAVLTALQPRLGEHAVDLYAGVGLFAGALAAPLGPGGRIDAVESSPVAIRGAKRSLHDLSTVHLHEERVERWLRGTPITRCDLVVLDPPRKGAGADVIERALALRPRAVAYVACDPAALARDVAYARDHGWQLTALRAFDIFPMTHHVECVALLTPATVTP